MSRSVRRLLIPCAALAIVAGCGDDDHDTSAPTEAAAAPATTAAGVEGDITVFAAASLTESFTDAGEAFEAANPHASVTFSFDGSSALVTQITEGAPADVFASADTNTMDELVAAGLDATAPQIFATNRLTIIVAPGNPLGITGVADLADDEITTVICATEVPCGNYADQIFTAAGVTVTPASFEQNVRGVTTKVTAGEADAGVVYESDVIAAGDEADMVEIPATINAVAEYPIAIVADSQPQDVDQAFIDFLLSDEGQMILAGYGFGPP